MSRHHHHYHPEQQHHHHNQRFQPPTLFSICRGEVTRIEPYGCFVKLIQNNNSHSSSSFTISGLVHISQLYTSKVTHVSDIVSLNDIVWVKVIDVQVETIVDDATTTAGKIRSRHRVKLSMKYVNQDSGKDLDPENELFEEDQQRVLNSSGNGGRGGGHQESGANSLLGRSLVSNIGMSTAIDPGSLILRGAKGVNGSTADDMGSGSFNGYALVGDDEGEPSLPQPLPIMHDEGMEPSLSSSSLMASNVIPMGRGRGMTLPAWMTKSDTTADKLGSAGGGGEGEILPNECTNEKNDENEEKSRRRRRRERHHTSITKERHDKHASSREKHERRDKDRHRQRRQRRRRDSSSSYSSKETQRSPSPKKYGSRSRSVERHSHRSRSHSRTRKKSHHRHHDKHYRSDRSDRSDRSSSSTRQDRAERSRPSRTSQKTALSTRSQQHPQSMKSSEFANVEEARAIVERLERRR